MACQLGSCTCVLCQMCLRANGADGCNMEEASGCEFVPSGAKSSIVVGARCSSSLLVVQGWRLLHLCACTAWAQLLYGCRVTWGDYVLLRFSFVVVGMAGGEPAGFGYWIGVLVNSGGLNFREEVPKEKRSIFRRLARFVIANEFDDVKQLCGGTCPCQHCVCIRVGMRWQEQIQVVGRGRTCLRRANWTC